jgi:hypothetical protein
LLVISNVVAVSHRLHHGDFAMSGEHGEARTDHRFAEQLAVLFG